MKEYYSKLVKEGRADELRNGVAIFNVGQGDVHKFPELLTVEQIWIYPSGNVQTIDISTVSNTRSVKNFYDFH